MAAAAAEPLPPEQFAPGERGAARQRVVRLEYATVAWNLLEVGFTVAAGLAARSLALVAFGLDSLVEVFASLVVIAHTRRAQRWASKLIAASFGVIGAWLVAGALVALAAQHRPSQSPSGIAFMALTVLVMFGLARAKRRVGTALGSGPVVANSKMTFLDGCVAAGVCLALLVDLLLGWWWCDAVIAGAVGLVALREGARHRSG